MKKEDDLAKAQEMLEQKLESVQELAKDANYYAIELRLVDEDGNVKIKGAMKVADMMTVELIHQIPKQDVVGMFFAAIEEDLENKLNEENEG